MRSKWILDYDFALANQNLDILKLALAELRHQDAKHSLDLFEAFKTKNWLAVESSAAHLYTDSRSSEERSYFLFWMIAGSEMRFDTSTRDKYFLMWRDISSWANYAFCRHLHMYQQALKCFFACELYEATQKLQLALQFAAESQYDMGQLRCYMHLGLVESNRSNSAKAVEHFQTSLILAEKIGSQFHQDRVNELLMQEQLVQKSVDISVGVVDKIPTCDLIEHLVANKDFRSARSLLVEALTALKKEKRDRLAEDLPYLIPAVLWGLGKNRSAERALHLLTDEVLQIKALELKSKFSVLNETEKNLQLFLQQSLGRRKIVLVGIETDNWRIGSISLRDIRSENVRRLLRAFMQAEDRIDKETICKKVWDENYDPLYHDAKIYRLLSESRKSLGLNDLFVNNYGSYSLNPSYLGNSQKIG